MEGHRVFVIKATDFPCFFVNLIIVNDRAEVGLTNLNRNCLRFAAQANDFFIDSHVAPFAVPLILKWIFRVDLHQIQVLSIRANIGHAPSDMIVVTNNHTGRSGKGKTGHIVGAGIINGVAVKTDFVPDGRHLNAEMGVIRQQGHP